MKKGLLKNILTMALVGAMTFGLVGCGSSTQTSGDSNKQEATETASSGDSLDTIKEKGKLVVGLSADYAPYEFHKVIDGKDQIVGFDVEIAKEIAKSLGVELEIKDMEFGSLVGALPANKIDMIISGMTPTEERKQSVDFSDIYYKATQGVLVKSENADTYSTLEALKGKKLGAQMGSIQADLAKDLTDEANVKQLGTVSTLISELKTNKIDGLVVELPVAETIIQSNPDLAIVKETIVDEEGGSAIAVRKNSPKLLEEVNKALKELQDSGKLEQFIIDAQKLTEE